MKINGILNSHISRVLSYMRHTDTICIGDCGLPCPDEVELIDLSLELGKPSFFDVLTIVSRDIKVEKITLASEIKNNNVAVLKKVEELFPDLEICFISHEEFKKQTEQCKAIIRTGENTPYANIILQSACVF